MKFNREILRKHSGWILIITGLAILFVWNFSGKSSAVSECVTAVPVMSTTAVFRLKGANDKTVEKAVQSGIAELRRIEAMCNYFNPESELGRLNASAADVPFRCSKELWELLTITRKYHELSNGAFDPTIRPLMKLWGFHSKQKKLPSGEDLKKAKELCGLEKVFFNDSARTVYFTRKGMSLDLGGIAKGWALDKAAEAVRNQGITDGILDLGGNLLCLNGGGMPDHRIGIRDPLAPDRQIASVLVRNASVATSGSYERFSVIDGKRYSHIMNPKTGLPVPGTTLSASVITEKAVDADALSTTLFLCGPSVFPRMEKEFPGIRCLYCSIENASAPVQKTTCGNGWQLENKK